MSLAVHIVPIERLLLAHPQQDHLHQQDHITGASPEVVHKIQIQVQDRCKSCEYIARSTSWIFALALNPATMLAEHCWGRYPGTTTFQSYGERRPVPTLCQCSPQSRRSTLCCLSSCASLEFQYSYYLTSRSFYAQSSIQWLRRLLAAGTSAGTGL